MKRYCKDCGSRVIENPDDWNKEDFPFHCEKCGFDLTMIDTTQKPKPQPLQMVMISYNSIDNLISQLEAMEENELIGDETILALDREII